MSNECCAICGATEKIQRHHISYEPEIIQLLCVDCHKNIHGHGVGKAENSPFFVKFKSAWIIASKKGVSRRDMAREFGISYMTAYSWDIKCSIKRRGVKSLLPLIGNEFRIKLKASTRERLKKAGIKGETYDTIIKRLLEEEEERWKTQ